MDVGLVCDGCRTFNAMGSRACARCGEVLSLDGARDTQGTNGSASGNAASGSRLDAAAASGVVGAPAPAAESGSVSRSTCLNCHAPLNPGFRFCAACGVPIEEVTRPSLLTPVGATPARTVEPSSRPSPQVVEALSRNKPGGGKKTLFFSTIQAARAKLVLIKGDGLDGVSYSLAGEDHQAGRQDDVPLLFAEDPYMSPVHANFFYQNGKLVVRDESSTNGVYIRIRGAVPCLLGDRFLVGEQILEVQAAETVIAALDDGTYFYASPRAPSRFRIVQILRGGDTGVAHQAKGDAVTIGRESNDINFPDDPFISGHHARVSMSGEQLSLTDLGSKNGTFLRLRNESVLEHGDYVFMGQQLLRVEIV